MGEKEKKFVGITKALAACSVHAETIESDVIITELEKTDRISIMGGSEYTQYHDLYIASAHTVDDESKCHWISMENTQPMIVQWRKPGEPVVVYAFDELYSKDFELTPWIQIP